MDLVRFIEKVEGKDGIQPDGTYIARWDGLGKCWSIGPGLTHGITKGTHWTQEQVDAALTQELSATVAAVDRLVKVPLTENQHTVICSFAYNCGTGALSKSTLLKKLNAGDYSAVPGELIKWVHAKGASGPVPGLVNRRNAEIAVWNTADEQAVSYPENVENVTVPKAKDRDTSMNIVNQILLGMLSSNQMQSLARTALKGVAIWMITKTGGDPSSVDAIVGGLIGLISVAGSYVAHAETATEKTA